MPYIEPKRRKELKIKGIEELPQTSGELNYTFTYFINWYLNQKGESYQTYNDIIGALEGAKLELYARKVRPYEDIKIKENGDVYEKQH